MTISRGDDVSIYVLAFMMMFIGWYFGSSSDQYQYFETEHYVVRYRAKSNEACIVPGVRGDFSYTGLQFCEDPWRKRLMDRIF